MSPTIETHRNDRHGIIKSIISIIAAADRTSIAPSNFNLILPQFKSKSTPLTGNPEKIHKWIELEHGLLYLNF